MAPYAGQSYQYDTYRRVVSATIGDQYTYTYAYGTFALAAGYNNWQTETVETRPDGSTNSVFTNYIGQTILTDLADTSGDNWYTYTLYGTNSYDAGLPLLEAQPSAVEGYTVNGTTLALTVTLNQTGGLLDEYDYYGPNGITESSGGNSLAGADRHHARLRRRLPPVGKGLGRLQPVPDLECRHDRLLPVLFANRPGRRGQRALGDDLSDGRDDDLQHRQRHLDGAASTTYNYTWWNVNVNGTNEPTLQPQEVTIAEPVVTTAENGPGGATGATTADYYNAAGELTWTQDGRGILTAYAYDPVSEALTEEIDDANTSDVGTGATRGNHRAALGLVHPCRIRPEPCHRSSIRLRRAAGPGPRAGSLGRR